MAEVFDRQIDRWQLLADRVEDELTEVQKALVQVTARRNEMASEAAKLRQMKDQYLQDLTTQQQQDHSIEATTHLRRFLVHLDDTLIAVDQQIQQIDGAKRQIEQRYRGLYQEHSKFEALRNRVELRKDSHDKRVEQKQQDLLNVQRFSQTGGP